MLGKDPLKEPKPKVKEQTKNLFSKIKEDIERKKEERLTIKAEKEEAK